MSMRMLFEKKPRGAMTPGKRYSFFDLIFLLNQIVQKLCRILWCHV